jgi:CTP:molybdopterin cytidylyltransferase MocA
MSARPGAAPDRSLPGAEPGAAPDRAHPGAEPGAAPTRAHPGSVGPRSGRVADSAIGGSGLSTAQDSAIGGPGLSTARGSVLGVVLAAGGSSRMGRPKQVAELAGRPLLAHALAALSEAPVDRVVVALGAAAGKVLDRVELGRAEPVVVAGWAAGMGHVLARVLAGDRGDWGAVVVLLGDQPLVAAGAVERVVAAWRAGAGPVVTATYGGRPGHPRLFDRALLPELLGLSGDAGARDLVAAHPDRVHRIECGDLGSDADVDVEADLERVGRMLTSDGRKR